MVGTWKRANSLTNQFYNKTIVELKSQDHSRCLPHDLDDCGIPWDERINTKNRSKYETRRNGLNVGWFVTVCNNIADADRSNINYEYYIAEATKLVDPLRG